MGSHATFWAVTPAWNFGRLSVLRSNVARIIINSCPRIAYKARCAVDIPCAACADEDSTPLFNLAVLRASFFLVHDLLGSHYAQLQLEARREE